jgi:hypothetical protein
MKFLIILEKAWLTGAVVAFVMGTVNIFISHNAYQIYMPYVCSAGCVLIYMNVRGQRMFKEKMQDIDKTPKAGKTAESED